MPLRKSQNRKSRSRCKYGRKKSARQGCKKRPGPKRKSSRRISRKPVRRSRKPIRRSRKPVRRSRKPVRRSRKPVRRSRKRRTPARKSRKRRTPERRSRKRRTPARKSRKSKQYVKGITNAELRKYGLGPNRWYYKYRMNQNQAQTLFQNLWKGNQSTGLKKKFYELSKKNHPDKGGNNEAFKLLSNAYNVLKNEQDDNDYKKLEKDITIKDSEGKEFIITPGQWKEHSDSWRGGKSEWDDLDARRQTEARRQAEARARREAQEEARREAQEEARRQVPYGRKDANGDDISSVGLYKINNVIDQNDILFAYPHEKESLKKYLHDNVGRDIDLDITSSDFNNEYVKPLNDLRQVIYITPDRPNSYYIPVTIKDRRLASLKDGDIYVNGIGYIHVDDIIVPVPNMRGDSRPILLYVDKDKLFPVSNEELVQYYRKVM